MRGFYIIACFLLGTSAVLAKVSVVNCDYRNNDLPDSLTKTPALTHAENESILLEYKADVIYKRDAFSDLRCERAVDPLIVTHQVNSTQIYSFELRGINAVGSNEVALLSFKPVSPKPQSRDKGSFSTPLTSGSGKVFIVRVGEKSGDTAYRLKSIDGNKVIILDPKKKEMEPLAFSLTSNESLKRGELAFKSEISRLEGKQPESLSKPTLKSNKKKSSLITREEK